MFISERNPIMAKLRRPAQENQMVNIPTVGHSFILRLTRKRHRQHYCPCFSFLSLSHTDTLLLWCMAILLTLGTKAFSITWLPAVPTFCLTIPPIRKEWPLLQSPSLKKKTILEDDYIWPGLGSHPCLNLMWQRSWSDICKCQLLSNPLAGMWGPAILTEARGRAEKTRGVPCRKGQWEPG